MVDKLVLIFTLPSYILFITESMKTFGLIKRFRICRRESFLDISRTGDWFVFESKHEFKQ